MKANITKKKAVLLSIAVALLLLYLLCLPRKLFQGTAYSTVVLDKNGELLGARIADDGQWRFPPCDTVPYKYAKAVVEFEDRWFYWHPGVNPVSIVRAATGNLRAGHVTSGGSTITMQVARMSRGRERTFWQKMVEALMATRLELRYSKKRILALYASHAPYGGNVVGLDAASWRYFGRPADELSWGEAATLAILPNSPSSIHPGKNRDQLLAKRNRLLKRLMDRGYFDAATLESACDEPLPDAPLPLPQHASHLVDWYKENDGGKIVLTSIDIHLQEKVENVANQFSNELSESNIADLAAVVMDVHSGEIIAYVGNASPDRLRAGSKVDIVRSPRSTGSILKPLLYCALLQDGEILPNTLIPDIPININGFSPQNFDLQFNGAVPASEALARSLNVPAVHMLRRFGVPRFYDLLKSLGMTTLTRDPADYGLSLILGGAEGSLLDITGIYASLSREYQEEKPQGALNDRTSIWYMFDALKELNRPDEIDWRMIRSVKKIAWKTGTSYGFRDAWAVGVTPRYAVGVWAGNAQGQGVPGLTGARTAGPVMFELFNLLPSEKGQDNAYAADGWFLPPIYGEYVEAEVCKKSGHLKNLYCDELDTLFLPPKAMRSESCPYHHEEDGKVWFTLPPSMEWYYKQNHPEYEPMKIEKAVSRMEFIYPESGSTIYIPKQLSGDVKGIVFNLAHRDPSTIVYWHLDNEYLGETSNIHQMTLTPSAGPHTVTVVDASGTSLSIPFTIAENR